MTATVAAPFPGPSLTSRFCAVLGDETRPVRAPFTGEVLYDLPLSTSDDVVLAVARAREVQSRWAQTPLRERVAVIRRFHDLVLAKRDEAMDILQWETGKARGDALEEVLDVCVVAQYYGRLAGRVLRTRRRRGALPLLVGVEEVRRPVGVVGVITPWNYPLTLAAGDTIPALIAGNGVIVKPDPQTSLIAAWVADQFLLAGLPDGLFSVVTGDGPTMGSAVIDAVDYVMFTGSSATGRIVAERCARRLIGCSLELGGKNAMIIRADADLARAAEIAVRACFANTGQLCMAMERIYVHADVHEEFLAHFIPRVLSLRIATAPGWQGDLGCLVSPEHLARVQAHVDDALSAGAIAIAGGRARPDIGPLAFEPTVLEGVDDSMILCRDETFGPVVSVYPVLSDDEAIARANDTAYGLNASILSRDVRAARAMARRLHSGSVNINEGYAATWGSTASPVGGLGDSGLGRRHGEGGLLAFTESQTIATQRFLGFGPQLGLDRERWGEVLAAAVGAMKHIRF
ncbi:MAG: succinate-semialdehyde dehydrogenase (NADP(+)) [Actinomycetales bacterium]|nr:succinate-semialdehyde dehydrogenase (NADP(+)) [Actinomycetales bacterium]